MICLGAKNDETKNQTGKSASSAIDDAAENNDVHDRVRI